MQTGKSILFYFLTCLSAFLLLLPKRLALAFGRGLGISAFYLFRKRRKLALANIHEAFGESRTTKEQQAIVKNVFIHLALNFIEFFRFDEINKKNLHEFVTFYGRTYLEKAYAAKKGVLVLTAHIGNWELLAGSVGLSGFNTAMVVKKARQNSVEAFLTRQRTSKNIKLFSGKNVIKPILKQLHAGGIVGIVLDQSAVKSEGVEVSFFNRPASTLKSLAVLAMRTEATVLPMYIYRKNNHHHIIIHPPIIYEKVPDTGRNTDEEILLRTQQYTISIEDAIREHPEQWIWTHRRWKIQQ